MQHDAAAKKNRSPSRGGTRGKATPSTEPREAALRSLAKREGNDGVKQTLSSSETRRDALLAFIGGRLGAIRNAQQAEARSQAHARQWVDQLARGAKGVAAPDPSRWSAPAQAYRHAIEALAAGDLARGTHLLERAHEAERRAFEALPAQVDLPESERSVAPLPDEARGTQGEGCPRRGATELLAQADAILRVSDDADVTSGRRVRQHRGWWDREPDAAQEDKDTQKKGSPGASQPGEAVATTEKTPDAQRATKVDAARTKAAGSPARTPDAALEAPVRERLPETDTSPTGAAAESDKEAPAAAADRVRTIARKKR